MMKIRKGDTVLVTSGKEKGKQGTVLEVFPGEGKLRIEGLFLQKRHVRPGVNPSMPNGGIVEKPAKVSASNVKFFSTKLGKAVRVGFKTDESGNKVRVALGRHGNGAELD